MLRTALPVAIWTTLACSSPADEKPNGNAGGSATGGTDNAAAGNKATGGANAGGTTQGSPGGAPSSGGSANGGEGGEGRAGSSGASSSSGGSAAAGGTTGGAGSSGGSAGTGGAPREPIPAVDAAANMGKGINLGQMFENIQHPPTLAVAGPKIDAYYDRGFRFVRIPVTWTEHAEGDLLVNDPAVGDVDRAHPRLQALTQVIDYALSKAGM